MALLDLACCGPCHLAQVVLAAAYFCHAVTFVYGTRLLNPTLGPGTIYKVSQTQWQAYLEMGASCADICVTVTLLDGLVLARSQFNTDMVCALLVH